MNQDEMYTPAQAAKRLGVSVKTIHRWDKAGKLKTVRTAGNQRRIAHLVHLGQYLLLELVAVLL
ncbi:MAG: MerR family DNA-binding transcriptional regulator, partial [Clostridia bacterium]|nr:MerR family DNA-binding transcriptional regulator [Clostridia bacterium]